MKKYFRLLSFILVFVIMGSFSAGCGCNKDSGSSNSLGKENPNRKTYQGTHVFNAQEVSTEDYFIKDGRSEYKIVLSKNNSSHDSLALEEFNFFMKEATGFTLPFVLDDKVTYSASEKFISIGDTTLIESAGINYDKKALKSDGCRIITKDKSIFILGADNGGVVNGVYAFMKIYFNYEFYSRDCIEIDVNVKNAKLRNFDVTDVPDIPIRVNPNNGTASTMYDSPTEFDKLAFGESSSISSKNRERRYRYNSQYESKLIPIFEEFDNPSSASEIIHNVFAYVPANQVQPGWYSTKGMQLCYSASSHTDHFDEENFDRLAQHCANKIINSLKIFPRDDYPQYGVASLTQFDGAGFCDCKTCMQWREEDNNAISGGMIRLNNRVNEKVRAWMDLPENEPYKRENLKIVFFAYNATENCPVNYNEETKTYVPANEDVVMQNGTGVYYACMTNMSYENSIYDSINDTGRKYLEQWNTMTDYMWLWTYGFWYRQSMYFHDAYNYFNSDAYQYYAHYGIASVYNETHGRTADVSAFCLLQSYIQSKLMWDSSLNVDTLIENYMQAVYKDAAPVMKQLLAAYRMHFAEMLIKTNAITAHSYTKSTENYRVRDFIAWLDIIEDAYAVIDKYKSTDLDTYLLIKHRIDLESVFPLYGILELYGDARGVSDFTQDQRHEYILRLSEIADAHPNFMVTNGGALLTNFVETIK